jgi:hypothetical protein
MEETILPTAKEAETIEETEATSESPADDVFYRERYEALLAGVTPAALEDALTLARVRVTDEIDIKAALADVLETYPVMKTKASVGFTGIKTGSKPPQVSGVEAAFIAKNPGIKL